MHNPISVPTAHNPLGGSVAVNIEDNTERAINAYIDGERMKHGPPNPSLGELQVDRLRPNFLSRKDQERHLHFFSPVNSLRRFGHGVHFLFYTLRYFILVFFVLSVLSVMSVYANSRGTGLRNSPGVPAWMKTTIGNFEPTDLSPRQDAVIDSLATAATAGQQEAVLREFIALKNRLTDQHFQSAMLWNVSFILLYIIAIYLFKYLVLEERLAVSEECASIARFSLRIQHLPPTGVSRPEIEAFVRQFTAKPIVDVNFAYDFKGRLHDMVVVSKKKIKLDLLRAEAHARVEEPRLGGHAGEEEEHAAEKVAELTEEIEEHYNKIEKTFSTSNFDLSRLDDSLRKIEAYVVFEESEVPLSILAAYEAGERDADGSSKFVLGGRELVLSVPEEVGDINFENIDVPTSKKALRIGLVIGISLLVIAGFLMLTIFLEYKFEYLLPHYYCTEAEQKTAFQTLQGLPRTGKAWGKQYYCFCKYNFAGFAAGGAERAFCQNHVSTVNRFYYLSIFIIGFIELVNIILTVVLEKLMKITLFASKTNKFTFALLIFFVNIYLNTVLSIIISSEWIFGPHQKPEPGVAYKASQLRRFDAEWFELFGYKIIVLIFFLTLFPHVFLLAIQAVIRAVRDRKARSAKTHKEYVRLRTPFKFALAEYYVIILNAVFSTLTFAAGMPLLVILCFFTLIALFACLKYMFIHFSKRPRFLKPAVVQLIVKLLPVSVVIHLVVAIVIYGFQFETTSVRQLIAESGDEGQPAAPLAGAPSKLYNAFFVKCLPLTIILFVFIGLMLLEVLVYKCLKPALKRYFKDTKAANLRYSENLRNLKYWSALNYDFRMLPKYTPLLYHAYASQLGFNADPMASQYPKLFGTGASGRPLSPHKFANHELNKLGTIREENEAEDATFDYIQTAESRKMNQNRALAANLVGILPKPGQDPRPAPHK